MNKCNSQSSLVSKLIKGQKRSVKSFVLDKIFFYSYTLAMFCHVCSDCLSDFCLKICYVRIPASEIKSKENPSSSYYAFGFAACRLCAWILTRGVTLKEMYNDINHSRST